MCILQANQTEEKNFSSFQKKKQTHHHHHAHKMHTSRPQKRAGRENHLMNLAIPLTVPSILLLVKFKL